MANEPLIRRAQGRGHMMATPRLERILGHPLAFAATAALLIVIFGWTFFTNPGRPAAADDPAYYTWRTEALLANDPATLLDLDGPREMYAGGYRVATPVLAGVMRRVMGVAALTPTIVLAVGLRVLIPLLLAGFAYRARPDPLIWHAIALSSASLLLTPPFGGYLDNVMTLFFLSAALYLIGPARTSWGPRVAFFGLLLVSGFTHPTTLAIFCLTLGAMALFRLILRGFALRSVIRDDGPMLVAAFLAVVATVALWKLGIWGESAALSEAALPPPAGAGFFRTRLNDWLSAMRPILNLPLFLIGLIGLLATGRRAAEEDLTRVAIVWLAPLIGVLGFVAGVAYPYYRFFNTTTAWLLLIGLGAFFVIRYCLDVAGGGGVAMTALVGVLAVAFVIGTNFTSGLEQSGWNDPSDAWIKSEELEQLDVIRTRLDAERPVVFIVDDEITDPVRVYGFVKRAGNVVRYGLPMALQSHAAVYLGSAENFLAGKATPRDDYYESLSQATLTHVEETIGDSESHVLVLDSFNQTGENADGFGFEGKQPVSRVQPGGQVTGELSAGHPVELPQPSPPSVVFVILAGVIVLLPGLFLLRWALPDAGFTDALGLVPALSAALLVLTGIVLLGLGDSPLTSGKAWTTLVIAIVAAVVAGITRLLLGGGRLERESVPAIP